MQHHENVSFFNDGRDYLSFRYVPAQLQLNQSNETINALPN